MLGVHTFVETFRGIVYHFSLALLLGLIAFAAIAWMAKTVAAPLRRLIGGSIVRIALAVAMVGTGIVESFSKHTNDPPRRAASPTLVVTPTDISNGWRVTATREGHAPSRPQDGTCTIHEPWLLRGGFEDVVRISVDGWFFPWRDGFTDGLTVFSDGEIRLALRTPYFPRPFDAPLAVVPAFNWHLLPDGVSNVFWHASTPSNSLVVAWENAPVGNDINCLTNFQAEFFAGGRFSYRYDDHVVDYAPVFPFDWDNDGLENSVDPDPLFAGPDAHGTNAEWYNVVCSNVVNSNAYYFVDVVASNGPAPIYFTGDRESSLGDPVVVALTGETNHVPLLIGIDYAVTSTVPVSVSLPDDSFATVTTNSVSNYAVQWPLAFTVAPDGTGFRVTAEPYDPGCVFQWELPTRSATCSYTTDGGWIGFSCNVWSCECDGCSVSGVAVLEEASFDLPNVWCGCWHYDPLNPGTWQYATNGPSVFVSFDKPVVFYEDAYTNAPNEVVAKHSTNTTLTVFAYGGDAGGMLYVSDQKIGKLVRVGGKAISFPYTAFVPPQSGVSFSIKYEAETHSDFQNDISVSASMLPGDGGTPCTASASVTAAEILIEAEANFPTNKHRHVFGPAEMVKVSSIPVQCALHSLSALLSNEGSLIEENGFYEVRMPVRCGEYYVTAQCDSVEMQIQLATIFPNEQLRVDAVRRPTYDEFVDKVGIEPFTNGCIGAAMHVDLSLVPDYVSFSKLRLAEGIASARNVEGFFTNVIFQGHLDHGVAEGAWDGISIEETVRIGLRNELVGGDTVAFGLDSGLRPFLEDGSFDLEIPMIWFVPGSGVTNNLHSNIHFNSVNQSGTVSVKKYDKTQSREITEDWSP